MSFLQLVVDQMSPDNTVRAGAETQFSVLTQQNPTDAAFALIQLALDESTAIEIRQACLLHLRRMVPKFWSLGFASFVGPVIPQDLKLLLRQNLILLATSCLISKLRTGAAYVITQIAAADYPDEWPTLLDELYALTTRFDNEISMIGGLTVLNELFDDLITEEQFWEGGVGSRLISHIIHILEQPLLSAAVKTATIKLYQSVFNTLKSPEAFDTKERTSAVNSHVQSSVTLFLSLLDHSMAQDQLSLAELNFRYYIYTVLCDFVSDFHKKIQAATRNSLLALTIKDFHSLAEIYNQTVVQKRDANFQLSADLDDPQLTLVNIISSLIQTVGALQTKVSLSSVPESATFADDLVKVSMIPLETVEEYEADFNDFVTEVTGLSTESNIREPVGELLAELNELDSNTLFKNTLSKLNTLDAWQLTETYLYLLECLFTNEDNETMGSDLPLQELLTSLNSRVGSHPLVSSRLFLLLPKFFEKFSSKLSVSTFGVKSFANMLEVSKSSIDLVKASALVSVPFYNNLSAMKTVIPSESKQQVQTTLFDIVESLVEDSEEDTLPVLLEAITVGISIDEPTASKIVTSGNNNVIDLIFKVSFKDASNVQLNVDAVDSLTSLLHEVELEDYLKICEKSLPFIFDIINRPKTEDDYAPELQLALELLSIIIENSVKNSAGEFPKEVFLYTFPPLKKLIMSSQDDHILRIGGQALNGLLVQASQHFIEYQDPDTNKNGLEIILMLTEKFLSNELSDYAALNCGLIINSVFEHFKQYLDQRFLTTILDATVRRLTTAKDVITTENLIIVFCKLILFSDDSCNDLINYLSRDFESKTGLQTLLPIWFSSYEVVRGYEKIKMNTLALGKLFFMGSEALAGVTVNGDIIPFEGNVIRTRSMTKTMPDQYTQIPAPLKILKLFVSELRFQCQQPDAEGYLPEETVDDDGEEGWEDMEDIGVPNYEKLKSYVEDDEGEDATQDESLKMLLVQFFRECTVKNQGDFQKYYDMLDDEDKRCVMENVVF